MIPVEAGRGMPTHSHTASARRSTRCKIVPAQIATPARLARLMRLVRLARLMRLVRLARLMRLTSLSLLLAVAITTLAITTTGSAHHTSAATACLPSGQVLDHLGQPVPGIHLRLSRGPELLNLATNGDGRYNFATTTASLTNDVYANSPLSIELLLERYSGFAPRFQILHRQQLPAARVAIQPTAEGCAYNFDFRAPLASDVVSEPSDADWPALIQLYQRTERAWQLLDSLGIADQAPRPFRIYASCDEPALACPASDPAAPSDFAGFVVGIGDAPFIVLGELTSKIDHINAPDNREYHELGHLAQYLLTNGRIPVDPENTNHGGYYGNPSSTDSWVEGFASFFSVMVSKHAEGDLAPERYRLYGSNYDLEADHRAWEWSGWWEELALSGLLLDLEDGDQDYQPRPSAQALRILGNHVVDLNGIPGLAGEVRNTSAAAITFSEVTVELLDASGNVIYRTATPVLDATLAPGAESQFLAPLPYYLGFDSVRVTPGPMHTSDDDPVDLTLDELLAVIRDYTSTHPLSAGRLFDVTDLHTALSDAFGGSDLDADGIDDIDQLFIAHGFFADAEGSRPNTPTASAELGLTTHPAYQGYPARIPRREVPTSPASFTTLSLSNIDLLVHIEHSAPDGTPATRRSYGYIYRVNDTGEVMLPAPTSLPASTLTLIALPKGEAPQLLGQASATALWDQWTSTPGDSIDFQTAVSATTPPAAPPALAADTASEQRPTLLLALAALTGLLTIAAYVWVLTRSSARS